MQDHMSVFAGAIIGCLLALAVAAHWASAQEAPFVLWAADPMVKLPRDSRPPEGVPKRVELQCARNEYEPAQLALTATRDVQNVTVRIGTIVHENSTYTLPRENATWNFVGFVRVEKNTTGTPRSELICEAPADVPDPLLPDRTISVAAGQTQPIWLTIHVPEDAPAGEYAGTVTVAADGEEASLPIKLRVWPFPVPHERHLFYTNWFNYRQVCKFHGVEFASDEFWPVLEAYARAMAAHRQNVLWVPLSLIKTLREPDGTLSFDYANLDRWIEICERHGLADRIELTHLGHHGEGGWSSKDIVLRDIAATDRATGKPVTIPAREALPEFLAALQEHLDERGWLERAVIHIADEPSQHNIASWRQASAFVHKCAPRLKRIDAIEAPGFEGMLEVWVPKLNLLRNWHDSYRKAQEAGAEMWLYTCLHPTGYYPNRFTDYPLIKTRILHWLNWRYALSGYLHWGLCAWSDEPYETASSGRLPPGDGWIIYPGRDGPVSSIRWEMVREGLEDYEYLWLLAERRRQVKQQLGAGAEAINAAARSDEIARSIVRDFVDYVRDPEALRAARERIAAEIVALERRPLLVVQTDPPEDVELVPAPIVVRVIGATEPGATVTVNGAPVELDDASGFALHRSLSPGSPTLTVTAELNGQQKTLARRFRVRALD